MANTTGKKFGGREKGTPNKLTAELRSALKDVLYEEIEQIPHRLDELEAKDRLEQLIKLMPYVFPKVQSVSQSLDKPMSWERQGASRDVLESPGHIHQFILAAFMNGLKLGPSTTSKPSKNGSVPRTIEGRCNGLKTA
jgi:hypothetical protein